MALNFKKNNVSHRDHLFYFLALSSFYYFYLPQLLKLSLVIYISNILSRCSCKTTSLHDCFSVYSYCLVVYSACGIMWWYYIAAIAQFWNNCQCSFKIDYILHCYSSHDIYSSLSSNQDCVLIFSLFCRYLIASLHSN